MMRERALRMSLGGALVLVIGACASGGSGPGGSQDRVGKPATISHIHGLGVDADGVPFVATHVGLIREATDGGWVYASADTNDHMGFSLHAGDGVMYRSGHSATRPSLGVESSRDGSTWVHLSDVVEPPVDFHAMAVSFADALVLWGSDSGGRGAFRSNDGGATWTALRTEGLERQVYVLAGPAAANVVYAGTAKGLYRSADGGLTWGLVSGLGSGWVAAVGADPKDASHMMVSSERGLKATSDGGKTWTDAGTGLPTDAEITSIAISPADPLAAFAADASTVYKTLDGGRSWSAVSTA